MTDETDRQAADREAVDKDLDIDEEQSEEVAGGAADSTSAAEAAAPKKPVLEL